MSKLPLGIQTFSELRNNDYLYVDKTAVVHQMVTTDKYYFLSRPRRFGKSILVSTLESLFLGKKALFDGLAITDTDYDFAEYPVIKMEFTRVVVREPKDLENYIINVANAVAKAHDITLELASYEQRFAELVIKLAQKDPAKKVVLLVDEYDKPILSHIDKPSLGDVKEAVNGFYAAIKSLDEHLRFVFITGVSRFAKVSVFSGMNNLTDISMSLDYATICGVTDDELQSQFVDMTDDLAQKVGKSQDEVKQQIKHWYNGYRFHPEACGVYNPYSLLSLFRHREFNNYWYESGTPTFLLTLLKQKQYDFKNLAHCEIGGGAFAASEPENINLPSLFFQTGYLTITDFNKPLYTLDFPNYEVKKSFFESVATDYSQIESGMSETFTIRLNRHLQAGDLEAFFETLEAFFANIPYNITLKNEKYFQSIFYAVFTLMGFDIQAEVHTNRGRIDCVLQTADTVYIIEFKLNDSKEAALQQIKDKQYAQKYQGCGKSDGFAGSRGLIGRRAISVVTCKNPSATYQALLYRE